LNFSPHNIKEAAICSSITHVEDTKNSFKMLVDKFEVNVSLGISRIILNVILSRVLECGFN
jgi:hypothetical protein